MNLLELLRLYPSLFMHTGWYRDEPFLRTIPNEPHMVAPLKVVRKGIMPKDRGMLPLAADLANAYVRDPMNPVWDDYMLCRDTDSQGQAVFVAGCKNGRGFEIHRSLEPAWGTPSWG